MTTFFESSLPPTSVRNHIEIPPDADVYQGEQQILASIADLPSLEELINRTTKPKVMIVSWGSTVNVVYIGRAADDNGIFSVYRYTQRLAHDSSGRYLANNDWDEETSTLTSNFRGVSWGARNTTQLILAFGVGFLLLTFTLIVFFEVEDKLNLKGIK